MSGFVSSNDPPHAPRNGGAGFTFAQLVRLPGGPQKVLVLDQIHEVYAKRLKQARKIHNPERRQQVIGELHQQLASLIRQAGGKAEARQIGGAS